METAREPMMRGPAHLGACRPRKIIRGQLGKTDARYDARKGRFKASDKGCVFVKLADPSRGWALLEEEKLSL